MRYGQINRHGRSGRSGRSGQIGRSRRILGAAVAAVALGAAALLPLGPAGGLTNVGDEAALRAAFGDAGETAISLTNDITLTNCGAGEVLRNSATALTVNGNGFTVTQTCLGARVFRQAGAGALTFAGVTITGGNSAGGGGGISTSSPLTLQNTAVVGNSSTGASGGGIVSVADITITNSVISGNTAFVNGGGLDTFGDVTVTNSTISGNTARRSGGGILGRAVTITNSTISGNTAEEDNGGGVEANGPLTVTNSTISDNTAAFFGGGLVGRDAMTLVYVTVASNSAQLGANLGDDDPLGITSFGTVVASPGGGGANCSTRVTTSNGYNYSTDGSCGFDQPTDVENGADPQLAPLADNGGGMLTRKPAASSPIVDAIPVASCQADGAAGITTDQVGNPRPFGAGCDIGALEDSGAPAPVPIAPRFTG